MTDFKVGDKVRYTKQATQFYGVEGEVSHVFGADYIQVTITHKPSTCEYGEDNFLPFKNNIELINRPFGFKDIREGDLIRRTISRPDGSKVIWEGVAYSTNYDGTKWLSEGDFHLYYSQDDIREEVNLELIERPKPKHWAFTKPVGSIVIHRLKGVPEYTTIYSKIDEKTWKGYLAATGKVHEKTVEALSRDLRNVAKDSDLLEWLK